MRYLLVVLLCLLMSCEDIEDTSVDTEVKVITGDMDCSLDYVYATHIDYKDQPDVTLYHNIPLVVSTWDTAYQISCPRSNWQSSDLSPFNMIIMKDEVNKIVVSTLSSM